MDSIKKNKQNKIDRYHVIKSCDQNIIKNLKERDFESSIFYILKGYYPKTFYKKTLDNELYKYIDRFFAALQPISQYVSTSVCTCVSIQQGSSCFIYYFIYLARQNH